MTLCLYKNYVIKLNSLFSMLLALQVKSEPPYKPQHQHTLQRDSDSCIGHLCHVAIIFPFMFNNTLTQKHLETLICTCILASTFQHSESGVILSCVNLIFCQI